MKHRCQTFKRRSLHNKTVSNPSKALEQKCEPPLSSPGHQAEASRSASTLEAAQIAQANLNSVAQVVQYNGLWGAIKTFPKRKPFLFNLFLSGTLMPIADYQIQKSEGKKWDKQRTMTFFIFGLYNGTAWWMVYVTAFSKMFPRAIRFSNLSWAEKLKDKVGQRQLLGQCCVDLFLYVPLCYYPMFYSFKAVLKGESIMDYLRKYKDNFFVDNGVQVGFFVPGDIVCFTAPAWLRMPVTHAVSYGWNLILSYLRGSA